MLHALANGTDDERWEAARAAAQIPGGAKALGDALLRERNARVREVMFTSLSRISTPESAELMLPLMRSDDANLRTGAMDALRAMPSIAADYVPKLLQDGDADVRILACELARNFPGDACARLLCGLLDTEREANVCASAVEVLAEVGGPEALPVLARCADRFRDTSFLQFAIKITADRIRSASPERRV